MVIPEGIRAYAAINLDNLKRNFEIIKSNLPESVGVIAVVKANAYGHGAVYVARALEDRCAYFAVATPAEAYELRENGIKKPILIIGYSHPSEAARLSRENITQCVFSLKYARELSAELPCGQRLKIHIKLNTGMTRLGFDCTKSTTVSEITEVQALTNLEIEGVFAHYAAADDFSESEYTQRQLNLFQITVKSLEEAGIRFKYKHHSNSAGCLFGENSQMNLARAGIMLYGSYPSQQVKDSWLKQHPDKEFLPVMSLYGRVAQIRKLEPDTTVGYGRSYRAPSERTVAVVTLGYADGIPRLASNRAKVISSDISLVGRVCMDMLFADITDTSIDIRENSLVELFGEHSLPIEALSAAAETISYEVLCAISKRIPRVIYSGGSVIAIV